jgi:protease I
MNALSLAWIFALLMAGGLSASAQYDGVGTHCVKCGYCGYVNEDLYAEDLSLNPYDDWSYCPWCGTFYGFFGYELVPCGGTEPTITGSNASIDTGAKTKTPTKVETTTGLDNVSPKTKTVTGVETGTGKAKPQGKILMVVPPKDYQELEFNQPKDLFQREGFEVKVASKGTAVATGSSPEENVSVDLDLKKAKVNLSGYQAVVFVGGEGVDSGKIYEDADYMNLARDANKGGLVVGAICLAPKILANAGLLKERNATSSDPEYIKGKGAKFVENENVVSDGYLITGNGPDASVEFANKIVDTIKEKNAPITPEQKSTALTTSQLAGSPAPKDLGPKYKCPKCAYVYDPKNGDPDGGVPAETPFSKLPSNWKCPVCSAPKSTLWQKVD